MMEVREQPKLEGLFPVSKDAVDKALKEIAKNPARELMTEGSILYAENPDLNIVVGSIAQTTSRVFIEGALWTHKILRHQAETHGLTLPKISTDTRVTFFAENRATLERNPETSVEDWERQRSEMLKGEPELYAGLEEISKYHPEKSTLLYGASTVLDLVKRADRTATLGKLLSGAGK